MKEASEDYKEKFWFAYEAIGDALDKCERADGCPTIAAQALVVRAVILLRHLSDDAATLEFVNRAAAEALETLKGVRDRISKDMVN